MDKKTMAVICDSREKVDSFNFFSYPDVITEIRALKTGDFSIKDYEDKITIDRKRNCNVYGDFTKC